MMERANPLVLMAGFLFMALIWGGAGFLSDGVYLAKHEGDAVHLVEILMRMGIGQQPHVDFMTPIGAMSFEPIAWFMSDQTGVGRAFILAQIAVLVALSPAVLWVGISRLTTGQSLMFAFVITVLATAFVHGESDPTLSVSMHYNRWAWALSFIAVALAILPARDIRFPAFDGLFIGFAFALLLLTKLTYVAALGPAVLIALIARREWAALVASVVAGTALLAAWTIVNGTDYWFAYLRDLLVVMQSENRSNPGLPFREVVAVPANVGASLVLLASVILLRQSRATEGGLILLFLVPGFFYVTFQNFGNDPQWLYLLPIILLAFRPEEDIRNGLGWDMGRAVTMAAVVASALAAPSFLNLVYSPFRHLSVDASEYRPLLPDDPVNNDILTTAPRAYAAGQVFDLLDEGQPMAAFASELEDRPEPVFINGEEIPSCELAAGVVAYFRVIAADLEAAGYAGSQILAADVFSTIYWLYGDFQPLMGGAPWSYGTAEGLRAADYFLVPNCPLHRSTRGQIVKAVTDRPEVTLTIEYRGELYTLYRVSRA